MGESARVTATLFARELEHGLCVGVRLPDEAQTLALIEGDTGDTLHPLERQFAAALPLPRQRTFLGGRLALRHGLLALGIDAQAPLLATSRGAPAMPPGVKGSISHKAAPEAIAVALLSRAHAGTIGVDLELVDEPREASCRFILTQQELACVEALPGAARWTGTLLRFAIKEAAYKALDPWVERYVDYREAFVQVQEDGTAEVSLNFETTTPLRLEARWMLQDQRILATAVVSRDE